MKTPASITASEIKRAIMVNSNRVIVAPYREGLWLTDSHWAAPIERHLAHFAKTYGIATDEPGVWWLDRSKEAHRSEGGAVPDLERVIAPTFDAYSKSEFEEVFPYVADFCRLPVCVSPDEPVLLLADKDHKAFSGLKVGFLRLLGGSRDICRWETPFNGLPVIAWQEGDRYLVQCRMRIYREPENPLRPHVIVTEHELVTHHRDKGRQVEWVEDSRAVLMPVRL